MSINVFCIVAKTGAGKSEYLKRIISDKNFINKFNLKMLTYGTTRKKREGEVNGIDYYFHTKDEFHNIPREDLIEVRSYFMINDGEVEYFTKKEYFETESNILCITSPYQFENYRNWISKQNILYKNKYNLNLIIIDTSLENRLLRSVKRLKNKNDKDILEICRRLIEEAVEYDNVASKVPELIDPMTSTNTCFINNDNEGDQYIEENISIIKEFIRRRIK